MFQRLNAKNNKRWCAGFIGLCMVMLSNPAWAKPIYLHDHLLQGDVIGTVLDIDTSVHVQTEKTTIDMRDWLPNLREPVLIAKTTYAMVAEQDSQFSLFSLNVSKEPQFYFDAGRVRPSSTRFPQKKLFYENSFRDVETRNNPLGALLSAEYIQGYTLANVPLLTGSHELVVEQRFDVYQDSTQFVRKYGIFILNPQWQGQLTGLLRAWDVQIDLLVPPTWKVQCPKYFDRSGDVVTFHLNPSDAVLSCIVTPPVSKNLYTLVTSSLWMLLLLTIAITGLMSYAAAHFVEKSNLPPRLMMLVVVVFCMGLDWILANQLTNYLQTEAFLNHLSLSTLQEIQHMNWIHNFYGSILTALVACFVYIRSLEVPLFNESEEEVESEEMVEDVVEAPPVPQPKPVKKDPPAEFMVLNAREAEEAPVNKAFDLLGRRDDDTDYEET